MKIQLFRYFILLSVLLAAACTPQRNLVYFQGALPALKADSNSLVRIYPGDILSISVFTINNEAYPYLSGGMEKPVSDNRSPYEKGYVLDDKGNVKLPLIGAVNLTGMTIASATSLIEEKFKAYIADPIVTLKKLNFKITVLGEVNRPGTYQVMNEKATLLEALGLAGDLSTFGDRKSIRIIRTENNVTKDFMVDLTSASSLTNEVYFLHPDDVIYVSPVPRRAFQNISPAVTVFTSILTTAVVVVTFIITTNKN
jgi:polysaccharide export outer membrane protein